MQKQLDTLYKFQKAFEQEHHDTFQFPTLETMKLRLKLMRSEIQELEDNYAKLQEEGVDREAVLIKNLDDLADILFVVFGTVVAFGAQRIIGAAFDEVTASNMSKLDENGKPIVNGQNGILVESEPLGKALKTSPLYFEPDLKRVYHNYLEFEEIPASAPVEGLLTDEEADLRDRTERV